MGTQTRQRALEAEKHSDAGDYKTARRLAKAILSDSSASADERDRARRVLRVTGADPVAVGAILFTFCTLAFLVVKYAF